jgi:hypothetical protein
MRARASGEDFPSRVPGVFAFLGGAGGLGLAFPFAGWLLSLGFGLSV